MKTPKIRGAVIRIGYRSDETCVYSEILDLHAYYDGVHVWDDAARVKRLKLRRLRGYVFNNKGDLDQDFETMFDLATGLPCGRSRVTQGIESDG